MHETAGGPRGEPTRLAAAQMAHCVPLEQGLTYSGQRAGYSEGVASVAGCCGLCDRTKGCLYFSHVASSERCELFGSRDATPQLVEGAVSGALARAHWLSLIHI